jgi:hypothetical protein
MDENGRFFTQQVPSETAVEYGPDGRAQTLISYAAGDIEFLRAERVPEDA